MVDAFLPAERVEEVYAVHEGLPSTLMRIISVCRVRPTPAATAQMTERAHRIAREVLGREVALDEELDSTAIAVIVGILCGTRTAPTDPAVDETEDEVGADVRRALPAQ